MTNCLGCKTKGEEQTATTVIAVGHQAWDLCGEHATKFADYLVDLFKDDGLAPAPEPPKRTVVVTGTIPGYEPDTARQALENHGFTIAGHVTEDTAFIVAGIRPAPHKIQEATEAGTPCFDATKAGAFRDAVTSGQWTAEDPLPAVAQKKTADDVRRESEEEKAARKEREAKALESYVHWQTTEVPKRMAESAAQWRKERGEKEQQEVRRIAKASLPPEQTESQKIREWAAKNGYEINSKGRIPEAVKVAYAHAHAGQEALIEVS
ncbi:hypothetical protein AB0I84_07410 [Streptomyces spectabilis]|uniref:Lsr2 family DNA-binding protein n=1 Tax=Streptomyces spectabilis TaxID=68270 RepID=UPI0033C800AD